MPRLLAHGLSELVCRLKPAVRRMADLHVCKVLFKGCDAAKPLPDRSGNHVNLIFTQLVVVVIVCIHNSQPMHAGQLSF
jgi:hypothetical protein